MNTERKFVILLLVFTSPHAMRRAGPGSPALAAVRLHTAASMELEALVKGRNRLTDILTLAVNLTL